MSVAEAAKKESGPLCDVWANAHACDRRCHRQLLARAMRGKVCATVCCSTEARAGRLRHSPTLGVEVSKPAKSNTKVTESHG